MASFLKKESFSSMILPWPEHLRDSQENDLHQSLQRSDTQEVRKRILELTQGEAKELGIGKSTLHSLRLHARSERPFRFSKKVAFKLEVTK